MSYLHSQNIIHRDLATRNLLVSFSDNVYVIKISDFGMSKLMENASYYTTDSKVVPGIILSRH
jgi:serine/threonine protein kinase